MKRIKEVIEEMEKDLEGLKKRDRVDTSQIRP
jgi:hypothetical protein